MRLTPAQIAIHLICGQQLPMSLRDKTRKQLMREGRAMLVRLCKVDCGFNRQTWHERLCSSKAGGYTWGRREGLPKMIEETLADPEWQSLAEEIAQVDAARLERKLANRKIANNKPMDRTGGSAAS